MCMNRKALLYLLVLFLLCGGSFVLEKNYSDIHDSICEKVCTANDLYELNKANEIAIELRFLEEKSQDLTELRNNFSYLADYDNTDFAICGMANKAITLEDIKLSLIDLSEVNQTTINFNTEYLFWSANRKIVKLSYRPDGDFANWITTSERILFLNVVLSKEYYPDTVFYYAGQQGHYMFRPKIYYPRTYDEYTQIEE